MAYVTSVPYQDPATGSFDVVSVVWRQFGSQRVSVHAGCSSAPLVLCG